MHTNLRSLINLLQKEKQLHIIDTPVNPHLELAEIHRRVICEEGPALLFTNVIGSSFPVVTNLFGTSRRIDLSFGPRPEQLTRKIAQMAQQIPPTLKSLWNNRSLIKELLQTGTRNIRQTRAPVLENKQNPVNLKKLPVITSWKEDGGPFITLPLVYTEHPHNGSHNLGMYRMQIFNENTTGMHWQIHKGGGFHSIEAEKKNQPFPVHVFLGGPPALIASAIAPLPEGIPELMLTSLIVGGKIPLASIPDHPYPVISEAEFALSGYIPPHKRRIEGPFGDHYGYYSLEHEFPIFEVKNIYHRKDAIYPATIVGKPKQEDYYLGEFLQRLLSPAFPLAMPGIRDLWTYAETGFHSLASAVVRESYKRESLVNAFRILGEGQLSLTKFLIITDQSVPLQSFSTLFETVLERFDPQTDFFIFNHTSMDTLDYTGRLFNRGSKALLMGTGDILRTLPAEYSGPPLHGISKITLFCKGVLVLETESFEKNPAQAAQLLQEYGPTLHEWPFIFLVDDIKAATNQTDFLWTTFTRFDPGHDIYAASKTVRHHVTYQFPFIVDARMKPGYPDELEVDPETKKRVDQRWKQYFPMI